MICKDDEPNIFWGKRLGRGDRGINIKKVNLRLLASRLESDLRETRQFKVKEKQCNRKIIYCGIIKDEENKHHY